MHRVETAVSQYPAHKSVKSLNFSVNASHKPQSFDICTQTRGKLIAEPEILCLVKPEAGIEVTQVILRNENPLHPRPIAVFT